MNKPLTLLITGIATALLLDSAVAQQDAPMPTPVIEIYTCNFTGTNDMADVMGVATRWNAWADRNNVNDYTAFVATPFLYSTDLEYDALWLGGWPNGTAMGVGEAQYLAQGDEIAAAFDAVVECPSHAQYAEVVINAPQGPPPQNGIAVFRDCTVSEGAPCRKPSPHCRSGASISPVEARIRSPRYCLRWPA